MTAEPQVPDYRQYFNPMLKALKALGGSASIEELTSRIVADMKLPDAVIAIPHDPEHGGQSEVAYRIAWACSYLKAVWLITNSERGVWSLPPEGGKVDRVDDKKVAREVQLKWRAGKKSKEPHVAGPPDDEGDGAHPDEPDWKHELLEILHDIPADAFERLCQRLLRENGFVEVKVTGKRDHAGGSAAHRPHRPSSGASPRRRWRRLRRGEITCSIT